MRPSMTEVQCHHLGGAKPQAVFINKESARRSVRFLWGDQHPLVNKNLRLSCKDYYCQTLLLQSGKIIDRGTHCTIIYTCMY